MARTTVEAVIALLTPGNDYDTINEPNLTPFVDTASAVVDDVVQCITNRGLTLSEARRELLERWLAAHFYQQSDQAYASRSTLRASGQFQGQTGMFLENTKYGQTALTLDTSGCLSRIANGARKVARGYWAGKRPSEQTDYKDRD